MVTLQSLIIEAIYKFCPNLELKQTYSLNIVRNAIRTIMRDNPDVFWFAHQYHYDETSSTIYFQYTFSAERVKTIQQSINDVIDNDFCIEYVKTLTREQQIVYVYKWLVSYCNYNTNSAYNQSIYSVFVRRNSVCTGYAKAAQYLFNLLGIESRLVFGRLHNDKEDGRHCWNLVKVDNGYFHFDACFGDSILDGVELKSGVQELFKVEGINYNFLCASTDEMLKSRNIEDIETLPECSISWSMNLIISLAETEIKKRKAFKESLAYSISLPIPPHDANIVGNDKSCNVWMDASAIDSVTNSIKESNNFNYSYESFIPLRSLPDNTRLKKLNNEYEKTIAHLNHEQEQLNLVHTQIDELKKKRTEIENQLKNSPGKIVGCAVGSLLASIMGGFIGIAGAHAASTSSSGETREKRQENLLECENELEAKIAQAQMCERHIKGFIQQKDNLEIELAILEEQNRYNEVYSSIFAPAEVKRKSHLQVQVYLHLSEETEKVKSLAKESDKNAERRDYIPLSLKLRKGDKIDVEFNVYGETRLMSERKSIIWQGTFTKCSFNYFVPKDIDVDELSCEANLFVNGAMIGEMRFLTQIVEAPRNLNPEILSHRFNRIFISYAHQDSQQIKLLALAYKAQGVDYFYDRDSLAPGDVYEEKIFDYIDSSDLFVLCWSKNAAVSDYVAKEKERALLRAYPQLSQREATLKICPISIEPRADLPSDMKEVYNFEVI